MIKSLTKTKKIFLTVFKKIRMPLTIVLVSFAIIFTLSRALSPWVEKYKTEVEQKVSKELGQPVKIQSLETSWYWFRPVLKLNQVDIEDTSKRHLKLNKLLVGVNLWGSLLHRQLEPGILLLGDVDLVIRQMPSHWEIDGLNYSQSSVNINANSYMALAGLMLSQDSVIIKHLSAKVYLADGAKILLQDLSFKAVNSHGHYKMYGRAKLAQKNPTALAIIADLEIDPNALEKTTGTAYLSLDKFVPKQWLRFLPNMSYQVNQGICDLDLWFNIQEGKLASLQSVIDLKNISLVENKHARTHKIESFAANLAWRKSKLGWYLTADKIDLTYDNVKWPRNKFALAVNTDLNSYNVFVENILIDSVRKAKVSWPDDMQKLLKMHPVGALNNTQLHIQENKLTYLLTRFVNLGWEGRQAIPAVKKISGVLFWQPSEGRLILDGEKTLIAPQNYPAQTFDVFNADIYWKELSNGMRIDLDRFVLSNPNLTLSANGVLDNYKDPNSKIRLQAEFSGREAHKYMAYIPSGYLKPKFEEWLKHDVQRIKYLSGRMLISGSLDGFPYDKAPGKFVVNSHVNGVDLAINKAWPLNRDIDADLVFDKRSFTANVGHANLKDLQINKLNLAVNNIGYGTESLLIHGEVEAPGKDIKSYIYATPLKTKLARWKNIDIDDEFWIDLKLDIPLYPENEHVAALGHMVLSENPVTVSFAKNKITVKDVAGELSFNEYGLTGGGLNGVLDGAPLSMQARAMISPEERTLLAIEGEPSMDILRKITKSKALSLLNGSCNVSALWTIYPNPQHHDTLHLGTNMRGVAIDLPEPLFKLSQQTSNLTADLEFIDSHNVVTDINYNDILKSKFLITDTNKELEFVRGELNVGGDSASLPSHKGLRVAGNMDTLDFEKWRYTFAKLPKSKSSYTIFDVLYSVDVRLKKLLLAGESYQDLSVQAKKADSNNWFIDLQQAKFIANLKYAPKTNTLSGAINNLTLDTFDDSSKKSNLNLKPLDIPNLDLTVEKLRVKDVDAGSLKVKTTSTKQELALNSLQIKSPYYLIDAEGAWSSKDGVDNSKINFNLKLTDLAKSLDTLHIAPVVHSHNGNILFQGGFAGPIYDFKVKNLTGNMQVLIRNGRISNFDKAVEEKIGIGKILSILSLQTIPRRLKLDFSDLSEDGYSFDIFKGSFTFADGVMNTKDSYIDGPIAYAKMTGNLDLSKQLFDVNLRITPYITASLPVVATIAGGPVAGLATWVASNLINKGMQNISGYTYRVSGPWKDPVVQQVKIYPKSH